MNDQEQSTGDTRVNFDTPADLRKWPSIAGERSLQGGDPYLVVGGSLDQCIRKFIALPANTRHLYEIHTTGQPPLVEAVVAKDTIEELARLREFL